MMSREDYKNFIYSFKMQQSLGPIKSIFST